MPARPGLVQSVSFISFDELGQALASAGCQTEAAECHATLAGLICAATPLPADWMAQITGGGDSLHDCGAVLENLRSGLQASLSGDAMEFDLLLPDDEEPLSERASALAHWCQGFLFGLVSGGVETGRALPGDVAEVVSDFSTLSEAGHTGAAGEEDEQSYAELCEYVRVGAQLVYEELSARKKEQ